MILQLINIGPNLCPGGSGALHCGACGASGVGKDGTRIGDTVLLERAGVVHVSNYGILSIPNTEL